MKTLFKNKDYWRRYPVCTDPNEIEKSLLVEVFCSGGDDYELLKFFKNEYATNVLITPGSAGHAYVFAELGYLIHQHGFNVFIMPRHGGFTISELLKRHTDAVHHIQSKYSGGVHIYGEGLGGLVIFYLALAGSTGVKSITCENSPAILTEREFHNAMKNDGAAGKRRKLLLPLFRALVKVFPSMPIPIKAYLAWDEVIDFTDDHNRKIEERLISAYDSDSDFDKYYPLKAVMSLVNTPPPNPLSSLFVPTMFIITNRGLIPAYFKNLFSRLPVKQKEIEEIDAGVFWMVSNPSEASNLIAQWISQLNHEQIKDESSNTHIAL